MESNIRKANKENPFILSKTQSERLKRKGWAEAFKEMAANGDDQLIMPDVFT